MGINSSIEWTESTWNPVTGCTKISPGCDHCYAERLARRLKAMRQPNYINGFETTCHEHMLELPLRWKKPQTIFVNSMSDLFHQKIPTDFILRVFEIMRVASWHRFQILTKRSDRLQKLDSKIEWPPNVWMGVSVETEKYAFRLDHLRRTNAHVKFLSFEPVLGAISNSDLNGIHWVVVGGESGPKARPMKRQWVTDIRDRCLAEGVPFFFKQWGGTNKKKNGRTLDGRCWDEMPLAVAEASV